jgi:hypothetical protein
MLFSDALKMLARTYCDATGTSLHALGAKAGHPKLFKRLFAGEGFHSSSGEQAILWFAANWPDDLAWPRSISRPAVETPAAIPQAPPDPDQDAPCSASGRI